MLLLISILEIWEDLALGGLVPDSQGRWLFGFTRGMGGGHITRAEFFAVYFGFQIAWEKNFRSGGGV